MLKRSFLTLIYFCGLWTFAYADMTGREIINEQIERHKVDSEEALEIMLLVDKNGNKEKRMLKRYIKKNTESLNRFLLVFTKPTAIKGTALLTWEHDSTKDDQWIYLPALGKLKRIAEGSKKSYFMGTDFTYEDLEPEDMDNFNYIVIGTEQIIYSASKGKKEARCWMIESVPINEEVSRSSRYSKRILWVDQSNFFILKIEFFDKAKEHIKTQTIHNIVHVKGTIWRGNKTLMDNHKMRHKTLTGVKQRKINQPIDDILFTENFIVSERHIK